MPLPPASCGAPARACEADELVTVRRINQTVFIRIASPASSERPVLRGVSGFGSIRELAFEGVEICGAQPAVTIAVAGDRRHQLIDGVSRCKENVTAGGLCDIDYGRGLVIDECDRIRKRTGIDVRDKVDGLCHVSAEENAGAELGIGAVECECAGRRNRVLKKVDRRGDVGNRGIVAE